MNTKLSAEEYIQAVKEIEGFIQVSENYTNNVIKIKEYQIKRETPTKIDKNFLQARRLSNAIFYFLIKCKSGIEGKSSNQISEKLALIVAYFQGMHYTEELILKGQYIKASAILKQDFEIMTRLKQINAGAAKQGKQPNAKHAPEGLRFIYGQMNDIAHISNERVLGYFLERELGDEKGVSPIPILLENQSKKFYIYHIVITFEIVSEAIELYKEMYGMDENYKKARTYHKVLFSILEKFEKEAEALIEKKVETVKPIIEKK